MNTTTELLVLDLADGWPRVDLNDAQVARYVEELSDIPLATLATVVSYLLRTVEDFFPTIALIRRIAAEVALALPSEDEALTQIEERIRWASIDEMLRGAPPVVHGDVKRALDHIGGFFAYRATSEPSIVRAQFLKSYREIRAARIRTAQVSGLTVQLASVN